VWTGLKNTIMDFSETVNTIAFRPKATGLLWAVYLDVMHQVQ